MSLMMKEKHLIISHQCKCTNKFDLIITNDVKFDFINGKQLTLMVKCRIVQIVSYYINLMLLMMKDKNLIHFSSIKP